MDNVGAYALWGDAFGQAIAGGYDRLIPYAQNLAIMLITFSVIAAALAAMVGNTSVMSRAVHVVWGAGLSLGLIFAIVNLNEALLESAVRFGLEAGNNGTPAETFLKSPDTIVRTGYAIASEIWRLADEYCSFWFDISCPLGPTTLALNGTGWVVWGAFALAGFMVLSCVILYKLATMIGVLLLPLLAFEPTRQLGMLPLKSALHFAVQIAVLSCVIGVGTIVFGQITLRADPQIATVMPFLYASVVFIGTLLGSSRLAYSLTSGAMLAGGALLGAPAGMAIAAGRSAGGHMAGPVSEGASVLYRKMSGAASASTKSVMR